MRTEPDLVLFGFLATLTWAGLAAVMVWLLHGRSFGAVDGDGWRVYVSSVLAGPVLLISNAVLIVGAKDRLEGGNGTVRSALCRVLPLLPRLLGWYVIAASIGLLIRTLAERLPFAGRIAASLLGLSFQLASTFVIPVILFERETPVPALKRSASMFKKTWGESATVFGGLGLAGALVMIPAMVIGVGIGAIFGAAGAVVGILVALGLFFAALLTLGAASNSALYLYAESGQAPAAFTADDLDSAFKRSKLTDSTPTTADGAGQADPMPPPTQRAARSIVRWFGAISGVVVVGGFALVLNLPDDGAEIPSWIVAVGLVIVVAILGGLITCLVGHRIGVAIVGLGSLAGLGLSSIELAAVHVDTQLVVETLLWVPVIGGAALTWMRTGRGRER